MAPATDINSALQRRRRVLGTVGAVVVLAAVAAPLTGRVGLGAEDDPDTTTTTTPVAETATVGRGDLTADDDFTGTVGYGDQWVLPLEPGGIVTGQRPSGAIVDFGEELIRINERPLILAKGEVPMYRELAVTYPRMTGADVEQLQRFLIGERFDDDGRLEVDGVYGYSTKRAVENWQEGLGVDDTGRVDKTQLVFNSTALRIAADTRVGSAFAGLEVTEATAIVTVDTNSQDRVNLPVGDAVEVELADGTMLSGVVSDQERVILDDGSTIWRSTIELEERPPGNAAGVLVHTRVTVAEDVLTVPVSALLALAEGGFAVEVVEGSGTELVAVEVGTVLGGMAEINGEVSVGDEVVVPA